jgi:hypothetical protein
MPALSPPRRGRGVPQFRCIPASCQLRVLSNRRLAQKSKLFWVRWRLSMTSAR